MPSPWRRRRPDKTFTLYSARDFPKLPEIEWLIDGILPSNSLAACYGPSGVGKSFLALDMVAAIASGRDWFGRETKQGPALYVALEGQAGVRLRVKAWETHNGMPFPDRVQFLFDDVMLTEVSEAYSLAYAIEHHYGASLIVIDTLNRASPGADENSSIDMGNIIAGAGVLARFTGATVMLVHHPGKDVTRRLRGHSSLYAAMDAIIEVVEDGAFVRWKLVKSKDSEGGTTQAFSLQPVELGTIASGATATSCVVVPAERQVARRKQLKEPRGVRQQAVLTTVAELIVEQRIQVALPPPDGPSDFPPGLPFDHVLSIITDRLEDVDIRHRKQRALEAVDSLLRQGYLVMNGDQLSLPVSTVAGTS